MLLSQVPLLFFASFFFLTALDHLTADSKNQSFDPESLLSFLSFLSDASPFSPPFAAFTKADFRFHKCKMPALH